MSRRAHLYDGLISQLKTYLISQKIVHLITWFFFFLLHRIGVHLPSLQKCHFIDSNRPILFFPFACIFILSVQIFYFYFYCHLDMEPNWPLIIKFTLEDKKKFKKSLALIFMHENLIFHFHWCKIYKYDDDVKFLQLLWVLFEA